MFNFTESQENEIERIASDYGMRVHVMVGKVGVVTDRGAWHLIPTAPNNIKLMHENSKARTFKGHRYSDQYHNQHKNFMNVAQVMDYIKSHDTVCIPR